ncbi:hypothetical protein [Actinoplanes aureus]|uniref:Uncharacterized protein n=1 Tax=Actinoplanes aureus TaxID=2792083 RepID=A0A931CDS1_9ACTN|nr:hypothetical protein [Actinoplanes aureus]MBG0565328.1 hypothetical protein [Actinoplanes aureus]
MTLIESELRAALRAEAAAHRPDREAMLDRITRTATRNHRATKRAPRIRVAGAAVAVAAVLGGGGFAQWALAGDGEPGPEPTPAVTVPVSPAPSATPTTPAASSATSIKVSPSPRKSRSVPPSSAPPTANTRLWSDGSVAPDSDSQGSSVVTVKTTERLAALEVTIRVARTPELVSRGGSQQVPGASVTSTVTEEADVLVYRFLLSSGDTMEPGTYTFSARYTHAEGGRDAGRDTYGAVATNESGTPLTVTGDFA